MVAHVFNQKRCEQKVIEYVIMDEMSFKVVEGKRFLALMHEAQPRFKVPNRRKVAGGVFDLFLAEKAKIKNSDTRIKGKHHNKYLDIHPKHQLHGCHLPFY